LRCQFLPRKGRDENRSLRLNPFHVSCTTPAPCRIAILGFGTVGSAVARRLAAGAGRGLQLTHICDRRARQKRTRRTAQSGAADANWTDRFDDLLTSDVDVNAAVISGECAGDVEISGTGAGGDATAVAILSDILTIARGRAAIVPAPSLAAPRRVRGIGIWNPEFSFQIPNSKFRIPKMEAV
jgi:Homoserine dehydrogenase, NAD binding domain/Homoserine dehydrogenase